MILNFLSPTDIKATDADLIIENGSDIYICHASRKNGVPDTSTNDWQIKKIETASITIGSITGNGTKILYPNGSKKYEFSPESIGSYTFEYAR